MEEIAINLTLNHMIDLDGRISSPILKMWFSKQLIVGSIYKGGLYLIYVLCQIYGLSY